MRISGISNSNFLSGNKTVNNNFTGYYDILRDGAKHPVENLEHAENIFNNLIIEIDLDKLFLKNQFFDAIKNVCNNSGLRGLFSKFIKSDNENPVIGYIIDSLKNNNIISIANNKNSSFDIISLSGKSKDIHLGFSAGKRKGYIEFYTDKKGDFFVDRTYGKDFFSRGFYSDTGTKKVDISSYEGGSPEKTYYNKDGSKPFFKNLFLGGTPVEGVY